MPRGQQTEERSKNELYERGVAGVQSGQYSCSYSAVKSLGISRRTLDRRLKGTQPPGLAKRAELRFPSSGQSRVEAQLGPVLTGPGELRIGLSSGSSGSSGRCSAQIDDSM